jgi:hypothetical protein
LGCIFREVITEDTQYDRDLARFLETPPSPGMGQEYDPLL